jgi:hypothetical protein
MSEVNSAVRMNQAQEAINKREVFELRKINNKVETGIKVAQEMGEK